MLDFRIISIGTLSSHPLWNEGPAIRTSHATTTLIRSGERVILVDPALPPQALLARLHERSGLAPDAITDVFLTNFRPAHRAALPLFAHARWHIAEAERERVGVELVGRFEDERDDDVRTMLQQDIALLKKTHAAPDQLAEHVDLFPLPGYTPGTAGLLLALPQSTVLIASDAVPTVEHLERGQVLHGCYDTQQALESFKEAVEIADWIIPGHDNLTPNLTRRMF